MRPIGPVRLRWRRGGEQRVEPHVLRSGRVLGGVLGGLGFGGKAKQGAGAGGLNDTGEEGCVALDIRRQVLARVRSDDTGS